MREQREQPAQRDQRDQRDVEVDLALEELRERTRAVIEREGVAAPPPFGLHLLAGDDPGSEIARAVEREVFDEFFGNSPDLLAAEYGPYEATTAFLCVVDHERSLPAGTMRLILPGEAGFKSLHDIEAVWEDDLDDVLARTGISPDPRRTWDVATLAVDGAYRGAATGGLVSLALYQGLVRATLAAGVEWWVTVLDVVVLDLIQSQTERPFSHYRGVEPLRYLDSPSSVPVWADVPDWRRRIAEADPVMHELLCEADGLAGSVRPLDEERALEVLERLSPLGLPTRPRGAPHDVAPASTP